MPTTRPVPFEIAFAVADACEARIGQRPEIVGPPEDEDRTLTFGVDLTAGQRETLDAILAAFRSAVSITPEEWIALKPARDGLKAYLAVQSPNAAQTATAAKAIIRVLAAIVRD